MRSDLFRCTVSCRFAAVLSATMLLSAAPSLFAQEDSTAASAAADTVATQQVENFVHYVLIGKAELALAAGQAALDSGVSDEALAELVDANDLAERLDRAIARSRSMGDVAAVASKIESKVENGRKALARDLARIDEAVGMLTGTLRQQMLARERLAAADEHAVPALLRVIEKHDDAALASKSVTTLVEMKRLSVLAICAALPSVDPDTQHTLIGVLADIGWPTAIPFLADLASTASTTSDVKNAAEAAMTRLGASSTNASAQYTALAHRFFAREEMLIPHGADATNNLWSYHATGGLSAAAVATNIFCDAMTMNMARRALTLESTNANALSLFIAANLRRENTLGSDAMESTGYSPAFYATVAGPEIATGVLALAIDSGDGALVRDAIAALAQTADAKSLTTGGRAPMTECLRFSDRRVRLDAALALANAKATESFDGAFAVVPTLASAVSWDGAPRAIALGGVAEDRSAIDAQLTEAGFSTILNAGSLTEAVANIASADGVELVVLRGDADALTTGFKAIRANAMTYATPVLAIVSVQDESAVRGSFGNDPSVGVWISGGTIDTFRAAASGVVAAVSGSMVDEAEALAYAVNALEALESLATSHNAIMVATEAESTLLRALELRPDSFKLLVAETLSDFGTTTAASGLIDAALLASGDAQVALLDAATHAVRGSSLRGSEKQIAGLTALVSASEGATAEAASRLYGALNLGSAEAVKLILK
ncbi:MAG: hypothetical protein EXS10_08235 [Phycisphaerales bacterium]|nr:hypothetical protein [Phycisphaerales bacterium]